MCVKLKVDLLILVGEKSNGSTLTKLLNRKFEKKYSKIVELFEVANQGTQNRTRLEDCWNGRIESKNHRIIFCCSKKYLGIDARIQTFHTGGLYTFVVLVKRIYLVVISLSVIHF